MDKIKIIFFDIDGTLIDLEKKQVSKTTLEMLKKLKANGIKICIATGRCPVSLPKFQDVTFDAYLTFNGSYCYDSSEIIFSNPICKGDVQKVIRNAKAIGRPVSIATKDRLAANGWDRDLADYYSIAKEELVPAEDFELVSQQEIYQIMIGCRKEEHTAILDGVTEAKITAWWDRAVDIIPANGGKGIGIQKILEYYGFSKKEAMAFGDGNNDIEMLKTVGIGVAMENASSSLKEIASDQCGHVAKDGIYHYLVQQKIL